MNFGQTNLVKSAHSMPPFKNHSSQALVDLASKWGQPATSGPTWSGLGPTWPSRSVDIRGDTYFDNFLF
jgi:hypothetical protein